MMSILRKIAAMTISSLAVACLEPPSPLNEHLGDAQSDADGGANDGDSAMTETWTSVAVGRNRACAVDSAERVWCWSSERERFELISEFEGVKQVTVGHDHSCVRTESAVHCWGSNAKRQLNDKSAPENASPSEATSPDLPENISSVQAGGTYTCAQSDQLNCWGRLPDRDIALPELPFEADGLFSVGNSATCVSATWGQVECAGASATLAFLSDDSACPAEGPCSVELAVALEIEAIAVGDHHACVSQDRRVFCWGEGTKGRLGTESEDLRFEPAEAFGSGRIGESSQLTAGDAHTCAIDDADSIVCWGDNGEGQLGRGEAGPPDHIPSSPSVMGGGWVSVVAGGTSTCAINTAGMMTCWGSLFGVLPKAIAGPTAR